MVDAAQLSQLGSRALFDHVGRVIYTATRGVAIDEIHRSGFNEVGVLKATSHASSLDMMLTRSHVRFRAEPTVNW